MMQKFHLPPLMAGFTHFCSSPIHFYVFFSPLKISISFFSKNEATLQGKECYGEKAQQEFRKLGSFPRHHFFPGCERNKIIELHVINKIGNLCNFWLSICCDTLKMVINLIFTRYC